jgi:hypothetical protein
MITSPSIFPGFHQGQQDLDLQLTPETKVPMEISISRQGEDIGREVSDLVLILGYF